jgi:hypothetical protein
VPALFTVPATVSWPACTVTCAIFPWLAVTVMPWPGSAFLVPLAGLIVSPAVAAAWLALWLAVGLPPLAAGPLPEQAAAPASASTAGMAAMASRPRLLVNRSRRPAAWPWLPRKPGPPPIDPDTSSPYRLMSEHPGQLPVSGCCE